MNSGTDQGYAYPGMSYLNSKWGSYTHGNAFNYYLSPNVSSSYTHQWGSHFFKAMAGFQMELQENSSDYTYKDGLLTDDIYSLPVPMVCYMREMTVRIGLRWVCMPS